MLRVRAMRLILRCAPLHQCMRLLQCALHYFERCFLSHHNSNLSGAHTGGVRFPKSEQRLKHVGHGCGLFMSARSHTKSKELSSRYIDLVLDFLALFMLEKRDEILPSPILIYARPRSRSKFNFCSLTLCQVDAATGY